MRVESFEFRVLSLEFRVLSRDNWSNNEYTKPNPCDILEERQEFVGIAGENDEKLTA